MGGPFEEIYFNWLCAKVINPIDFDRTATYYELLKKLHCTEFQWFISGDDNRAEDGKELRRDFILQADARDDPEWRTALGCSVLEMLIAFSKRAEFQTDDPASQWFWEFIDNLGLKDFTDQSGFDEEFVDVVLEELIFRTYQPNGNGSMFPIRDSGVDQRGIEIWYQFCNYLVDQNRMI